MRLDEMETYTVEAHRAAPWRYAEPMGYREVPPMSGAMFLSSLLPALKGILGKVVPVIGGLLAKAPAVAGAPAGGAATPGAGGESGLLSPETVKLLTDFLQQLKGPAAPVEPVKASALGADRRYAVVPYSTRRWRRPLAALPALMPLEGGSETIREFSTRRTRRRSSARSPTA
jgi:hypothetical protein